MDEQSRESQKEEVVGERIGESKMEELRTGTRIRLTKRQKELIPETRWSMTKGAISYF